MIRVALLDMYNGEEGLGIPNLLAVLDKYSVLKVDRFEVRYKCELPGLDYDMYISSGGPGSPLEGDGIWDRGYFRLMDRLWKYNDQNDDKKYVFFICHSFQMILHHLSLANVIYRKKESFGVFPCHMTSDGRKDPLFKDLDDPFHIADFRHWQCVQPYHQRIENMGCKILALEKIRPHVPLERAVMAMRFRDEWVGVQFHPEADPDGMKVHFQKPEKRELAIEKKGQEKYAQMIEKLDDDAKLPKTYRTVLPSWINRCIQRINLQRKLETILND